MEVRYLYAFRQSGAVYQPVYLGEREDIEPAECTVSQLQVPPRTGGHPPGLAPEPTTTTNQPTGRKRPGALHLRSAPAVPLSSTNP